MDWYVRHFLSIWKTSMINSFEKLYLEAQSTLNHKFSTLLWKYHHDHVPCLHLTILTGKNCVFSVLLNSVQEWLLGCYWLFSYIQTINYVLYILLWRIKEYRCLKNMIHQIDSKYEWLLLSASFAVKFGLVFVLTMENTFS